MPYQTNNHMNLGYACINVTLGDSNPRISTNRSMIKKTFDQLGIDYAGELALQNCKDLLEILKWNAATNIKLFRVSSDILPWASEYDLNSLPQYSDILSALQCAGDYAIKHGIRITAHPGPFNVLTSPNEKVVSNTIKDLELHGMVFDMMGLSKTVYNKINIHCNGVYGDKNLAMSRFCENFHKLSDSVKCRLTVENDDKHSMYSVKDLMYIHDKIGIPITFDYHHHAFNTGGLTEHEALELAVSTWPKNIIPVVHYSESKSIHENNSKVKPQAHSDYIDKLPEFYGHDVDVMLECKAKELALLDIRDKLNLINN